MIFSEILINSVEQWGKCCFSSSDSLFCLSPGTYSLDNGCGLHRYFSSKEIPKISCSVILNKKCINIM